MISRKSISVFIIFTLLLNVTFYLTVYSSGTTTPTPSEETAVIIDDGSLQYSEKGEWISADGGVNGSYRYTTDLGSVAIWRFKVPQDGYYEIKALFSGNTSDVYAKYTVFYNETYIDSFYNYQSYDQITFNKNYGQFLEYKKDSWITVMVKSVSEGKCVADAISFKRLSYLPTPMPTAQSGYSDPFSIDAKNCKLSGMDIQNDYVTSCDSGDYFVINNVLLSGFAGHDSARIFSVNASVTGIGSNNKLEIRLDGLTGPLLGTVELSNTGNSELKFCEQAYLLNGIYADFKYRDVYIVFSGEGTCNFKEFKFSSPLKPEPAQTEFLDSSSYGNKICGYVKPGFDIENPELNAGFRIEVLGRNLSAITDSNGYFEIPVMITVPVSIKISKRSYLYRELNNITFTGSTARVGTKDEPVEIWPGDIICSGAQDGAINLTDIMEIAKGFNRASGELEYTPDRDINMDGVINMIDIIIVAKYFNKTHLSYESAV